MQTRMTAFIRRENIKHYRDRLEFSHDAAERATILELLAQDLRKLKEGRDAPEVEIDYTVPRGVLRLRVMHRQSGLFDRAAECERLMKLDPQKRDVFKVLRDMWITLANESMSFSPRALATEIEIIEDIQSSFGTLPTLRNPRPFPAAS